MSTSNEVANEGLATRAVVDQLLNRQPSISRVPVTKVHDRPKLHVTKGTLQLGAEVVWNTEGVSLLEVWRVVHLG